MNGVGRLGCDIQRGGQAHDPAASRADRGVVPRAVPSQLVSQVAIAISSNHDPAPQKRNNPSLSPSKDKTNPKPPSSNQHSKGGFHFSQAILPRLLQAASNRPKHPPTLIFTGATASLKASANFSSFAVSKFATRALVQSLTREFGPKGIHVAHAIIDGIIDTPGTADFMKDAGPDAKIDPETVSGFWFPPPQ